MLAQIHSLIAQTNVVGDDRDGMLAFALYDLATKARLLPAEIGTQFTHRAIKAIAAATVSKGLSKAIAFIDVETLVVGQPEKPKADIVILTVIDVEKTAVLKAFGVDARAAEQAGAYIDVHGRKCFAAQLSVTGSAHRRHNLQIYVAMVGEPRNVPCANVSRDIIEQIDVDLLMLVGIGGGNPKLKVEQGDVIGAQGVFYVEGGKRRSISEGSEGGDMAPSKEAQQRGILGTVYDLFRGRRGASTAQTELHGDVSTIDPEIVPTVLTSPAKEFFLQFKPRRSELTRHFDEAYSRYSNDDLLPKGNALRPDFEYHQGQIMCGEKVIVDNSLTSSAENFHRKLACVDMESYGFSASCDHRKKPWIIFRGISDFADPKKDDGKHVSASIAAAVTAHAFIKEQYVEREARSDDRL